MVSIKMMNDYEILLEKFLNLFKNSKHFNINDYDLNDDEIEYEIENSIDYWTNKIMLSLSLKESYMILYYSNNYDYVDKNDEFNEDINTLNYNELVEYKATKTLIYDMSLIIKKLIK